MNNFKSGGFKKGGSFGGRSSFGGNRKPEGRSSDRGRERTKERAAKADQEMFPATCTSCGRSCEVPFRPDGQKPVLCRECYAAKNSFEAGGAKRPERPISKFASKPERGFGDTPKFVAPAATVDLTRLMKQMDTLEHKLNKILALMETSVDVVIEEFGLVSEVKSRNETVAAPVLVEEAQVGASVKKPAKKSAAKKASKPTKVGKKVVKKTTNKAVKKSK